MDFNHHCHAYQCETVVHPKYLMCPKHWGMVPRKIQLLVWKLYRPGQEVDKQPSDGYLLIQRSAVWAVFIKETGYEWSIVPPVGSIEFMKGPGVLAR